MKLKSLATGLLMFSKAASDAVTITRNNYLQYICDDNMFRPTSLVPPTPSNPPLDPHEEYLETMRRNAIDSHYQVYCVDRIKYEDALAHKRPPCNGYNMHTMYECAEKYGMGLASTCETLRHDRVAYQETWNAIMPPKYPCIRNAG